MSSARNDRNSVQFGPARSSLEYKIDRLEEEVRQEIKNETVTTTQNITNYVDESITNITGNAELLIGDVVTYTAASNAGTVDIDGAVVDFVNASSVLLEAGDTIILSANEDYPDPFAVGLVARSGSPLGYDTYEFISPNGIPGLPRTVSPFSPTGRTNSTFLVYGTVAYRLESSSFTIVSEDWVSATRTVISVPTAIQNPGNSDDSYTFCIEGSVTAVGSVTTAGTDALAVNDGTVWTTHDYGRVTLAKRSSSGSIWGVAAQKLVGGVWTSGVWLLEIDGTGAVTDTDLSSTMWPSGTLSHNNMFCAAGNGHVVAGHKSTGPSGTGRIYVDGTVYPYTFDAAGTIPSSYLDRYSKEIEGDTLYYVYRGDGSFRPTTDPSQLSTATRALGIGAMDLTSGALATNVYPNITTASGRWADGEIAQVATIAVLDGPKVAYAGQIAVGMFEPAYAANAPEDPERPVVVVYDIANSTTTIYASSDPRVTEYQWQMSATGSINTWPRMVLGEQKAAVSSVPGSADMISCVSTRYDTTSGTVVVRKDWLEGLTL